MNGKDSFSSAEDDSRNHKPINYERLLWYQILHGDLNCLIDQATERKRSKRREISNIAKKEREPPKKTFQFFWRKANANKLQKWSYDIISDDRRRYSTSITKEFLCNDSSAELNRKKTIDDRQQSKLTLLAFLKSLLGCLPIAERLCGWVRLTANICFKFFSLPWETRRLG